MAIKDIGAAWKTQLKAFPSHERHYLDFRQYIYPPVNSSLAYTLITSADNQPGSHNLTGGYCDYILAMPSTFTLFIRCKPTFAYDVASNQILATFFIDGTHQLMLVYGETNDMIVTYWVDGGTARTLVSAAYTSNGQLQVWHNIVLAFDSTTGDTTGSALYINESAVDTAWDGNIDTKASNFPLFSLRHQAGTEGAWTINQVRLFPNKVATAAEVANNFKDLKEEEVVWNLNGEACGRTRCNVSRFVRSSSLDREIEEPSNGSQGANRLTVSLYSHGGEFADDQYADFDPTADQFNGTNLQKYLQKLSRLELETWYGTTWEPAFIGRLDSSLYTRSSAADGMTTVEVSAEDGVSEIAREVKRRGASFASKKLSDATEADSLLHLIARLATQKNVYNYLANSSFEASTFTASWTVAGAGATFSQAAGGLFGSNEGQLDYGSAICTTMQTVTMTGTKKLNKGESYNFSICLKSATAVSHVSSLIKLAEHDSGGSHDDTDTLVVLAGGEGWKRFEVTHTVTDATSDRLVATVSLGNDTVLSCDGAMLVQASRAPDFWVLNNNEGAAGVESADDADYASYDTVGFDADAVNIMHPFVYIPPQGSIWDELKKLADACGCMYLGMDACGTLKLRAKLKTGYADPSSLETITRARGVDSSLELAKANRIIGHGVNVNVYTGLQIVWTLDAVPAFITGGRPRVSVANGAYFPAPATYGDFWAKYGEVT